MAQGIDVPPEVDPDLDEVLRVWAGTELHVRINNIFGPQTQFWGKLLADVAVLVARVRLEEDAVPERETLVAIQDGYRRRMAEKHDAEYSSLGSRN
jgi:hypothetical protein